LIELKVAHCPNCGHIYQKNLRNLCPSCSAAIDQQYSAIEKYMSLNRTAGMEELSASTAIPIKAIQSLIRQGKISVGLYKNLYDACDSCEGPTRSGNLCTSCRTRLKNDIQHMFDSEQSMKERASLAAGFKFKS
jgi:hypothetical protein